MNGEDLGDFEYDLLPLTLEDITNAADGLNVLTVCDVDDPECCGSFEFLNPCVCTFSNITTEIIDCNEGDTTYFVTVDFDHVATNDSFQMGYSNAGDNIFLGTFAYSDYLYLQDQFFYPMTNKKF